MLQGDSGSIGHSCGRQGLLYPKSLTHSDQHQVWLHGIGQHGAAEGGGVSFMLENESSLGIAHDGSGNRDALLLPA